MTFVSSPSTVNPVFDYSSRDYASVYSDLLNRIPLYMPEWTSQSNNDFGIVLLQMFAYTVDLLAYYTDRLAGEAFIQTATQPQSIINLAAMLDYTPTLSNGASATLQITISSQVVGPITIPSGSVFSTQGSQTQAPIPFITSESLTIAGANGATPSTTGSVTAVQGIQYTSEAVATSTGAIDQIYPLQNNPVSAESFSVFVDLGTGPLEWTYTGSLITAGPFDQVYTDFVDANGVFYIVFGDGVNGYVPPLGSPITCTYQTNVGALGNVGAATITEPVTAVVGLTQVTNPLPATGGSDAESITQIQQNAPASLKTLNRAVTVSDIETLAIQVPGVQWASAVEATYQLVNLYIAPFAGGTPSSNLQTQVLNYIDPLVMANTTVTLLNPTYVPINITATIDLYDNVPITQTQQTVLTALQNLLTANNTGFGFRVSLGLIYQVILAQFGVNYATVTALYRQFDVYLTTALTSSTNYTALSVTQIPQTINAGDTLVINPGGTNTQTITAVGNSGENTINVNSFSANASYPIQTPVQYIPSLLGDCVLLDNEVPVAGTITLSMSGGIAGT